MNFNINPFFLIILSLVLCVEIYFYVYIKYILFESDNEQSRQHDTRPRFENSVELTRDIFRLVDQLDGYSMERLISGFCLHANISEISIKKCKSLLSWCCFIRDWDELTPEEQNDIDNLQNEVQELLKKEGHTLCENEIPNCHHIRHNLEAIHITHRPLCLYLFFFIIERIFENVFMYPDGFTFHTLSQNKSQPVSYWFKYVPSTVPVVFIHGICRGWSFYWKIIQAIGQNRTMILINYDCIKVNSLQLHVPDSDEYCENFIEILNRHRIEQCDVVCHSYGTFLCSWIIRNCADKVRRIIFIDPLMLTVALYETAYYLFYQYPQTMTDWIYYLFVRTNLPLANVLQRHFIWYNMVLKFNEIPDNIDVHVAFSGKEHLLDVELLKQLVSEKQHINWAQMHHAECMSNNNCIKDLINILHR